MKLGLVLGYWGAKPIDRFIALAQRAEALGFDIVCTSEAYGSDALTPLAACEVVIEAIIDAVPMVKRGDVLETLAKVTRHERSTRRF